MRLAVALLLTLATAAPAAAQDKTIYSSLPLSGDSRPQSEDLECAMQLALEDSGRTDVRYVSLNDATRRTGGWEPTRVAANARRARDDTSTVAYLGDFNSGASAISIPILNDVGIMQISPSNTYVGLTRAEGAERGEPTRYRPGPVATYARGGRTRWFARGGNTREGAVRALFETRDRASALGTYSIDANGDTTLAAYGGYRVTRGGRLAFSKVLAARP